MGSSLCSVRRGRTEDHPQRALHAALATRDELHRRGEDLRNRGRPAVEVRIGINTGEVVMRTVHTGGHTEYAPVGRVINLAARMQSAAAPGGIIVTEESRRLVEGYFALRELGPTEIKASADRSTSMRSWALARCAAISSSLRAEG